jgi:hypothetical protein
MTHRSSRVLCVCASELFDHLSSASLEMATVRLEWIFLVRWFYIAISSVWEETNREKQKEKQMVKVKSRKDERNQPGAYKRWFNEGSNDEKT